MANMTTAVIEAAETGVVAAGLNMLANKVMGKQPVNRGDFGGQMAEAITVGSSVLFSKLAHFAGEQTLEDMGLDVSYITEPALTGGALHAINRYAPFGDPSSGAVMDVTKGAILDIAATYAMENINGPYQALPPLRKTALLTIRKS